MWSWAVPGSTRLARTRQEGRRAAIRCVGGLQRGERGVRQLAVKVSCQRPAGGSILRQLVLVCVLFFGSRREGAHSRLGVPSKPAGRSAVDLRWSLTAGASSNWAASSRVSAGAVVKEIQGRRLLSYRMLKHLLEETWIFICLSLNCVK